MNELLKQYIPHWHNNKSTLNVGRTREEFVNYVPEAKALLAPTVQIYYIFLSPPLFARIRTQDRLYEQGTISIISKGFPFPMSISCERVVR